MKIVLGERWGTRDRCLNSFRCENGQTAGCYAIKVAFQTSVVACIGKVRPDNDSVWLMAALVMTGVARPKE